MSRKQNIVEPINDNFEKIASKTVGNEKAFPVSLQAKGNDTKSPLRYPGGKSRAVKGILSILIPNNIKRLCSPFFGGGSIELACADENIEVYGYDVFEPLVDFWQVLLKNPKKLANEARKYYPLKKEKFYSLQKTYSNINSQFERAVIYYVLNRCSFSGTTLSGGMSPNHPRFTNSSIKRIENFRTKKLFINKLDFHESIKKHKEDFLYLDPPYANGQSLYGKKGDVHKNFNHQQLKNVLDNREKWILSYNDCEYIRKLYNDYQIRELNWTYGMSTNKKSSEIVIVSNDLAA